MKEELDFFELNNQTLEEFDELMGIHLDKIKYLKITNRVTNTKLYNILGLCFNVRTLEVDSDITLDINRVFTSIYKPEYLENLILKVTKLPTIKTLKKFKNIKKIEMENIKFSDPKSFLTGLGNIKNIEEISLKQVDFIHDDFEFFSKFKGLKKLTLSNLHNIKFEKMDFLLKCKKLEEVVINSNRLQFAELNNLINGNYSKDILLRLESRSNYKNTISIKNDIINLNINGEDLEFFADNINFEKINNIEIILNKKMKFDNLTEKLEKVKNEINICILDVAKLTSNQGKILKNRLNVKKISLQDANNNITITYDIDTFISMREKLENLVRQVPKDIKVEEKYLYIYKYLLKNVRYEKEMDLSIDDLNIILDEMKCGNKGFIILLKNCLTILGIQSKIMKGTERKGDEQLKYWLQVRINNTWYNSDISLDAKEKKKMQYCLMSNEKTGRLYKFKSRSMYCVKNINPKIVNNFWKQKNINTELKISIIQRFIAKIKLLFNTNKQLPAPNGGSESEENEK